MSVYQLLSTRCPKIKTLAAFFLGALAFVAVLFTYYLMANNKDLVSLNLRVLEGMLLLDFVLFLSLTALIIHKIMQFRKIKKSKLQSRIVLMFSAVGIFPTVIVSIFSMVFFNYGIQALFNERVEIVLADSVKVAQAYLDEHGQNIVADALAMAYDLSSSLHRIINIPEFTEGIVQTQADLRGLTEVVLFRPGRIIATSRLSFATDLWISAVDYDKLNAGQVVLTTNKEEGKVRALVKLTGLGQTYLLVGRLIDSKVLHHIETTKGAHYAYRDLKNNLSILQVQFFIVFVLVSLLLLLASIWAGIMLADKLVKPIINLVDATNRVRSGDVGVEVMPSNSQDEINQLERAFNQMTLRLKDQHGQLTRASEEVNERRIFMETVISNLSSGVIVLDSNRNITVCNNYAQECLKWPRGAVGTPVSLFCPELSGLIDCNWNALEASSAHELNITRDANINLSVRMVAFHGGYIITFDDITKLVAAQKAAAWADIARKIAHEIKNPITPIYLAASRLKRLFSELKGNVQLNLARRYLDTVLRNSSNLSRIVDEFANFARMPNPSMAEFDVVKLLNAVMFSRQVSDGTINYTLNLPGKNVLMVGDEGQIELVLYNLLKNSSQSILEGRIEKGEVMITLSAPPDVLIITIVDNGPGFDGALIDNLLDPYVTTRPRGNGLGLAISKKIIDEHGGEIILMNNRGVDERYSGAKVIIKFYPGKNPTGADTKTQGLPSPG